MRLLLLVVAALLPDAQPLACAPGLRATLRGRIAAAGPQRLPQLSRHFGTNLSQQQRAQPALGRVAQIRAAASAAASEEEPEAKVGPISLKYVVLVLLVVQNSLTAILARSSRVPRVPGEMLYLGSVAVLVAEVIKLPICLGLITRDLGGVRPMLTEVYDQVVVKWRDTLLMGVPALCYCLQNVLFFVALSNLSATSYQLWSQSKTLFTALFFVTYLGQVLRRQQWLALMLLTAGVGLVQFYEAGGAAAATAAATAGAGGLSSAVLVGVAAVLASSLLSGFANVYFEKVVKTRPKVSIWMRNVQLGLFSLPQAASLVAADAPIIAQHGALVGFTSLAWSVVILKALGGLLVGAVVKYADNVLKTYATAIAIILTCVVSCVMSATAPSFGFLQGMAMVIASIFMYNLGGSKSASKPVAPPPEAEAAED